MRKFLQNPRRAASVMLVTGLLAAGFVAAGPVVGASALEIDCSYDGGLFGYIGAGRDGYTCAAGGAGAPSGGFGHNAGTMSGQTTPGYFSGSECRFPLAGIPDSFYTRGTIASTSTTIDGEDDNGDPIYHTVTNFRRENQLTGVRVITWVPGKYMTQTFLDMTLGSYSDGGVDIIQSQNCRTDTAWNVENVTQHIDDDPTAAGSAGSAPATGVTSTPTLTAVPGKAGQFFLRVDVSNHNPSNYASTFADIDLGLDEFQVVSVIQSPNDATCPITTYHYLECTIPDLPAGQTRSFLYVVTPRSATATTASTPVTTMSYGVYREHYVGYMGGVYSRSVAHAALQ
jgi:hypothetical protein